MTNEEAIKILKNIMHDDKAVYAFNVAIGALERDSRVDDITFHWNDEKHNFVAACKAFEDILKVYGRGVSDD